MANILRIAFQVFVVLWLASPLVAGQQGVTPSSPAITVAAAGDKLRFSSVGATAQIRVQILSANGEAVFDSLWKDGNVLNWSAAALANGSYRCTVMARDLEGNVAQQESVLTAHDGRVSTRQDSSPKITLLAHDGTNGEIVSTSGDLSFGFGDFLAGTERERMRLTAEGDLQIDGVLRATGGIMLPDGSVLTTAKGQLGSSPEKSHGGVVESPTPAGRALNLVSTRPTHSTPTPDYQFKVDAAGVHIGTTPTFGLDVAGNLNVGAGGAGYKLAVTDSSNAGLRVATALTGGQVASFGGNGSFDVDANGVIAGRFTVLENGNVGIGNPSPFQKLSVTGTVESTSGGFKFPDGSVQGAAITLYTTKHSDQFMLPADVTGSSPVVVLTLTVPADTYLLEAYISLYNTANSFNADNSRRPHCWFTQTDDTPNGSTGDGNSVELDSPSGNGWTEGVLSFHSIGAVSGRVDVVCGVWGAGVNNPTSVYVSRRRFTALRLGGVVNVQ
ncbi:MAG: hypothetical protein ACXV7D_00105 [Thermoanaerobaculia bacterium]